MQVVTHLIRSMEHFLSIPSEHRLLLNTKEVDRQQHNDEMTEIIINAVMQREATPKEKDAVRGYGGVPALRDEMDAVTELLEDIPLT